jgi:hypothetical protein
MRGHYSHEWEDQVHLETHGKVAGDFDRHDLWYLLC